jgi:hypothetical protein
MYPLVSVAIHTGKYEFYPMLQNILKSFLVSNTYPNIELILVESGQNEKIREWFRNLDLYNFTNLDGSKSSIRPNQGVNITKKLVFPDFEEPNTFFSEKCAPFIQSFEIALNESSGESYTYLAEDNQFIAKGNLIGDLIKILKNKGEDNHMVYFHTMQMYKYRKNNNRFRGPLLADGIRYFDLAEVKWDQTMLCSKKIYERLGPIKDWNLPHGVNEYYAKTANELNIKRIYPLVYPTMWFHNDHRDEIIKTISEGTASDPDYILFKIHEYDDLIRAASDNGRPYSTEDFMLI